MRAQLGEAETWIDGVYWEVVMPFLDTNVLPCPAGVTRIELMRQWHKFDTMRARIDAVPTNAELPPAVAAGLPVAAGVLNGPTLKESILTTEFGEYRINCLFCHRQTWCGVNHQSIYCPFRLIAMHPGKVVNFLGNPDDNWPAP